MKDMESLKGALWDLDFRVAFNQHYHQTLLFWFAVAERTVRILVGILAVWGLILAVLGNSVWSIPVAISSVLVALVLNIVPLHTYERRFAEHYQRWTALRKRVQRFQIENFGTVFHADFMIQTKGQYANQPLKPSSLASAFQDLTDERHLIEAEEVLDWKRLNKKCYEDENYRRWGVRTDKEVQEEVERRKQKRAEAEAA